MALFCACYLITQEASFKVIYTHFYRFVKCLSAPVFSIIKAIPSPYT